MSQAFREPSSSQDISVSYLWEVISSHQNTIGGPLQYLPHTIIEAQRGPVQRTVYLTPVQPGSAVKEAERKK